MLRLHSMAWPLKAAMTPARRWIKKYQADPRNLASCRPTLGDSPPCTGPGLCCLSVSFPGLFHPIKVFDFITRGPTRCTRPFQQSTLNQSIANLSAWPWAPSHLQLRVPHRSRSHLPSTQSSELADIRKVALQTPPPCLYMNGRQQVVYAAHYTEIFNHQLMPPPLT